YVVVAHGSEITGYVRVPGSRGRARGVLRAAAAVVAAGSYPARVATEGAARPLAGVVIPPGVDGTRFAPAEPDARAATRRRYGLEAEGFGIVFLEAAACGVPAVAGRSGGSHEAVVDGETGYVVGPRDVAAVRDAIGALVADEGVRAHMGEAARRRAVDEF